MMINIFNFMIKNTTFLSFDYGTKNIGVAVGQKITKSATVLPVIIVKNTIIMWQQIDVLVYSWKPDAIIVGMPYKLDGTYFKKITSITKKFISQIKLRYNINVYPVNEIMSTKEAKNILFQKGGYKFLRSKSIDSVAAKIILEEWLNNQYADKLKI